jgi:hypothetical protein
MSVDSDDATKLLAAASQCPNRSMRIVYVGEARILIGRERDRLRQQGELLDAIESELVRTSEPSQLALEGPS